MLRWDISWSSINEQYKLLLCLLLLISHLAKMTYTDKALSDEHDTQHNALHKGHLESQPRWKYKSSVITQLYSGTLPLHVRSTVSTCEKSAKLDFYSLCRVKVKLGFVFFLTYSGKASVSSDCSILVLLPVWECYRGSKQADNGVSQ